MTIPTSSVPARRILFVAGVLVFVVLQDTRAQLAARDHQAGPARREFHVASRRFAYTPARLEVQKDDVVKIVFSSDDIAHTFTLDAYRISKRAAAGQAVTFEFRADQAGTFPFYCALQAEDGCRTMHGELVVR